MFWVDGRSILRSNLNGTNSVIFLNGSQPLGITIDFVYNKLYWTDSEGTVCESKLDRSSRRTIYSDDNFTPFKVATVRNFVLVTSQVNNSYILINREDFSVGHIRSGLNTFYYGVSVVSPLQKPSLGELIKVWSGQIIIMYFIRRCIFLYARKQ